MTVKDVTVVVSHTVRAEVAVVDERLFSFWTKWAGEWCAAEDVVVLEGDRFLETAARAIEIAQWVGFCVRL